MQHTNFTINALVSGDDNRHLLIAPTGAGINRNQETSQSKKNEQAVEDLLSSGGQHLGMAGIQSPLECAQLASLQPPAPQSSSLLFPYAAQGNQGSFRQLPTVSLPTSIASHLVGPLINRANWAAAAAAAAAAAQNFMSNTNNNCHQPNKLTTLPFGLARPNPFEAFEQRTMIRPSLLANNQMSRLTTLHNQERQPQAFSGGQLLQAQPASEFNDKQQSECEMDLSTRNEIQNRNALDCSNRPKSLIDDDNDDSQGLSVISLTDSNLSGKAGLKVENNVQAKTISEVGSHGISDQGDGQGSRNEDEDDDEEEEDEEEEEERRRARKAKIPRAVSDRIQTIIDSLIFS